MKSDFKYSSSELENFVFNYKNDDSFLIKNVLGNFEKLIPENANEVLNESLLEFFIWVHSTQPKQPLNLSFFEKRIFENTINKIRNNQFGFVDGCGKGISYFLNTPYNTNQYIEKILEELFKNDEFTIFLSCHKNAQESDYSLSIGITGILLWLLRLIEKAKENERIYQYVTRLERLFQNTIKCMLIHTLPVSIEENENTFFPDYVKIQNSQTVYQINHSHAWERGDLSKILLLYKAGYFFENSAWIKLADNMGGYISRLGISSNTNDFTIFQGTAGIALIYQKLFEISSIQTYHNAYCYWIDETCKILKTNELKYAQNLLFGEFGAYLTIKSSFEGNFKWAEILLL